MLEDDVFEGWVEGPEEADRGEDGAAANRTMPIYSNWELRSRSACDLVQLEEPCPKSQRIQVTVLFDRAP